MRRVLMAITLAVCAALPGALEAQEARAETTARGPSLVAAAPAPERAATWTARSDEPAFATRQEETRALAVRGAPAVVRAPNWDRGMPLGVLAAIVLSLVVIVVSGKP